MEIGDIGQLNILRKISTVKTQTIRNQKHCHKVTTCKDIGDSTDDVITAGTGVMGK